MILFKLSIDFGFWDFVRRRKLSERIIFRFFCSNKSENNDRNELINIMNSIFYPPKPNKSSTPKTPQSTFPPTSHLPPNPKNSSIPPPCPSLDKKRKRKQPSQIKINIAYWQVSQHSNYLKPLIQDWMV